MAPIFSILFGPMPFNNTQAFIDSLRQTGSGPVKHVNVVGDDVVLGRKTVIIEMSPTSTSSGSDGLATSSGSMRLWLDEGRMFVMRVASDGGNSGQSYELLITDLNYAMPANKVDAAFSPPAGSTEVAGGGGFGVTSSGSGSASTPAGGRGSTLGIGGPGPAVMQGKPGFLAASQLPEGFAISGESSESNPANELVSVRTDFTGRAPKRARHDLPSHRAT